MAGVEIKLGRWMGAVPIEQGSEKGNEEREVSIGGERRIKSTKSRRTEVRCQIEVSCGGTSSPGELTTTGDYAAGGAQAQCLLVPVSVYARVQCC